MTHGEMLVVELGQSPIAKLDKPLSQERARRIPQSRGGVSAEVIDISVHRPVRSEDARDVAVFVGDREVGVVDLADPPMIDFQCPRAESRRRARVSRNLSPRVVVEARSRVDRAGVAENHGRLGLVPGLPLLLPGAEREVVHVVHLCELPVFADLEYVGLGWVVGSAPLVRSHKGFLCRHRPAIEVYPRTIVWHNMDGSVGSVYRGCIAIAMGHTQVGGVVHAEAPVSDLEVRLGEVGARWLAQGFTVSTVGVDPSVHSPV